MPPGDDNLANREVVHLVHLPQVTHLLRQHVQLPHVQTWQKLVRDAEEVDEKLLLSDATLTQRQKRRELLTARLAERIRDRGRDELHTAVLLVFESDGFHAQKVFLSVLSRLKMPLWWPLKYSGHFHSTKAVSVSALRTASASAVEAEACASP